MFGFSSERIVAIADFDGLMGSSINLFVQLD